MERQASPVVVRPRVRHSARQLRVGARVAPHKGPSAKHPRRLIPCPEGSRRARWESYVPVRAPEDAMRRRLPALLSALLLPCVIASPVRAQEVVQLPEDGVVVRSLSGMPARVCAPGARWLRIGFAELALRGDCVAFAVDFRDPGSRYRLSDYQAGTRTLDETAVTVAGAGDICSNT